MITLIPIGYRVWDVYRDDRLVGTIALEDGVYHANSFNGSTMRFYSMNAAQSYLAAVL